ncbi:hypothetical protein SAMN04488543_3222 [Friedmanniella luteola]|uniref:Uncharacterized protein n=1 Tax=Friedmanniella luteola TaxID=546871 RepID=A0A1H1Y8C1_9ACTN|nr:hypothetical protein [Friedmanniella luteola]SDT17768.1 hypothetical protein SAMN04488543_3222 [Friedmanniella luteola]
MDRTVPRESPLRSYLTTRHVIAAVALLALLALAPFFFASGLLAPLWAVVLLIAFWAALLVLGTVWFRGRPWWVVPLPVVAALGWFGAMSLGEALLGWTA